MSSRTGEDDRDDVHSDIDHSDEDEKADGSGIHLDGRDDGTGLHPLQLPFDLASSSFSSATPPVAPVAAGPPPAIVPLDALTLVSQLYQLAVSSLGPHSRPKLIHLNPDSPYVTLTTACSRLFSPTSNLPLTHPLSILLSSSLASASHSDGGLFTLALTCRLISHAFLDAAPPLPIVLHSHQLGLAHILALLSPSGGLLSHQPLTRLPAVLRFVRCILQTKPVASLSADETDYLSVLIVQSVLSTLSINADGSSQAAVIRYHDGVGFAVRDSELYKGVILDVDLPPPLSPSPSLRRYGNMRVLLYNTSLTFEPSDHHTDLNIETNASSSSASSVPSSASITSVTPLATQLVSTWQSVGVTAVFCQRVIHPMLRFLCHTHDILTVDRLSIRHIHAVQAITAATVQSTLTATPTAAQLGQCDVEERTIAGRKRLCLSSPHSQRPSVTLVLCNRTESSQGEMRVVVEQAVTALQSAIREDGQLVVVGGGGVVERQLAVGLRLWLQERQLRVERAVSSLLEQDEVQCRRLQAMERGISWCVVQVAEMLEDVGRLIGGCVDDQQESRTEAEVERLESETGEWRSVNVEGDEVVSWRMQAAELQVDDNSVLDSAALKRHAFQRAVEIAAVVMRVKQVIKSN